MFSQGIYYKFGKKVFNISIAKQLPLFVLAIIIVFPVSIIFKGTIENIALYATLLLSLHAIILAFRAWYQYESHQFMLDDFSIHVRTGIFNRREVAIPYRQIQDVTLEENYTERMFGVCELSVFTAGHDDSTPQNNDSSGAFFPMIDRGYATELQQQLLRRSNVQEIVNHEQSKI